ncbi:MAG: SCP2 sterol-binding domain-containing protein [Woeseiaceae bacterium]|nr:SCP2 sterol-binding domain-containing protein [Woeseiaceae bacterium]
MDPLETLLRPAASLINRQIRERTPARDLCAELDGTLAAIRVRDTGLAMYFDIGDDALTLRGDADAEPDIVITGSLITLAKLAASGDENMIRDGSVELTGDAGKAVKFQQLLKYAKPDVEEEMAGVVGDAAAHQLGQAARGFARWLGEAHDTMRGNVREYLQEESRDVPSRYEVERFQKRVNTLRDDVDRLEARINRLAGKRG